MRLPTYLDPSYLLQDEICCFFSHQVLKFNPSAQRGEVEHYASAHKLKSKPRQCVECYGIKWRHYIILFY